jgi:hypothetical protein
LPSFAANFAAIPVEVVVPLLDELLPEELLPDELPLDELLDDDLDPPLLEEVEEDFDPPLLVDDPDEEDELTVAPLLDEEVLDEVLLDEPLLEVLLLVELLPEKLTTLAVLGVGTAAGALVDAALAVAESSAAPPQAERAHARATQIRLLYIKSFSLSDDGQERFRFRTAGSICKDLIHRDLSRFWDMRQSCDTDAQLVVVAFSPAKPVQFAGLAFHATGIGGAHFFQNVTLLRNSRGVDKIWKTKFVTGVRGKPGAALRDSSS